MKVDRSKLVKVFAEIGIPTAKRWDLEKLQEKAAKLESLKEDDNEIEDEDLKTLYDDIVSAASQGKDIEVVDDEGEEEEEEAPKAAKGKKGAASANGKPAKGKAPPKKASEKGPGVIDSIMERLQKATPKKPATKEDVLSFLEERFPDRESEGMRRTIDIQVPNRLRADKGVFVQKNANGYWIEGDGKDEGDSPAGNLVKKAKATKKDKAEAAAKGGKKKKAKVAAD